MEFYNTKNLFWFYNVKKLFTLIFDWFQHDIFENIEPVTLIPLLLDCGFLWKFMQWVQKIFVHSIKNRQYFKFCKKKNTYNITTLRNYCKKETLIFRIIMNLITKKDTSFWKEIRFSFENFAKFKCFYRHWKICFIIKSIIVLKILKFSLYDDSLKFITLITLIKLIFCSRNYKDVDILSPNIRTLSRFHFCKCN